MIYSINYGSTHHRNIFSTQLPAFMLSVNCAELRSQLHDYIIPRESSTFLFEFKGSAVPAEAERTEVRGDGSALVPVEVGWLEGDRQCGFIRREGEANRMEGVEGTESLDEGVGRSGIGSGGIDKSGEGRQGETRGGGAVERRPVGVEKADVTVFEMTSSIEFTGLGGTHEAENTSRVVHRK